MDKNIDDENKPLVNKLNQNGEFGNNLNTNKTPMSNSSWFHLPKAVYFIIITELCERFTYYGLRSILILYLTQHLLLKEWNAVPIYHVFSCVCYLTTIFGCIISDNYLGKFKTMLILGTIYTVGSSLMSITAVLERNLTGPLISLMLIGFGTGGVKACVAPFGGDQVKTGEKAILGSYFSMFYFAINFGALLSTIITPILRANVACNGSEDCYPLAFGVPAILMGVAMVIFVIGRKYYIEVPVKSNIYLMTLCCISSAFKNWLRRSKKAPKKDFLDYASKEYDETLVRDIRILYNIMILFLPLPIYWALFEQLGSRWTLQATQMDGEITENWIILPDQMFIFNVLLVVILVVVFDYFIFPLFAKIDPVSRPLRKMTIGITFTSLAFLAAFVLQRFIESTQPPAIRPFTSRLVLVNSQSCNSSLTTSTGHILHANGYQTSPLYIDTLAGAQQFLLSISQCNAMTGSISINTTVTLMPRQMNFLIVDVSATNNVIVRLISDFHSPNIKGYPLIRMALSDNVFNMYQFKIIHNTNTKLMKQFFIIRNSTLYISDWNTLPIPGRYLWKAMSPQSRNRSSLGTWTTAITLTNGSTSASPIKILSSEVVIFYITFAKELNSVVLIPMPINRGSQLSVLWQLPQYGLISIGEVLVNIPGLTFSYDQAPLGMKSLVNSLWYLCDAFGNIIVIAVAGMRFFDNLSFEYLTFAIVCAVFNVIFAGLAYWYPMVRTEEYIEIS